MFEWIEGETVLDHGARPEILDNLGRLLASFHSVIKGAVADTAGIILRDVRLKLHEKLPVLMLNNVISVAHAQKVTELGDALTANPLKVCLIHRDFSPANPVLHGNEICSVDNKKIQFHVAD